jgi:hypothetical protein
VQRSSKCNFGICASQKQSSSDGHRWSIPISQHPATTMAIMHSRSICDFVEQRFTLSLIPHRVKIRYAKYSTWTHFTQHGVTLQSILTTIDGATIYLSKIYSIHFKYKMSELKNGLKMSN